MTSMPLPSERILALVESTLEGLTTPDTPSSDVKLQEMPEPEPQPPYFLKVLCYGNMEAEEYPTLTAAPEAVDAHLEANTGTPQEILQGNTVVLKPERTAEPPSQRQGPAWTPVEKILNALNEGSLEIVSEHYTNGYRRIVVEDLTTGEQAEVTLGGTVMSTPLTLGSRVRLPDLDIPTGPSPEVGTGTRLFYKFRGTPLESQWASNLL